MSVNEPETPKRAADSAYNELARELGRRTPKRLTRAMLERRRLNLLTRRL